MSPAIHLEVLGKDSLLISMFVFIISTTLLISTVFADFRLNPTLELNTSAIVHGKETETHEGKPNATDKPCPTTPNAVYHSAGPVNIYLNGGLVQQVDKDGAINYTTDQTRCASCPQGPPGPKGDQGPQGPQGPRGEPGPSGGGFNGTHASEVFVAFSVVMEARPFGPYSYYKIIQFDNVISNVGSGYNEDKGVFTAPSSGYYQFHVHAHTVVHKQAEVRVMFNSERVVSVWADGTVGQGGDSKTQKAPMSPFMPAPTPKSSPTQVHEMGSSNSFIIKMTRGQKVYCLLPANQVLAGLGFSSFSGHLLRLSSD